MTIRILLSIMVAALSVAIIYWATDDITQIPDFYAKNVRASLFTGFLTVGSFLLSLKVFIVVKLKENIFDNPDYIKKLNERRKLNSSLTQYGPVKRLSRLLFISIAAAMTASTLQLSVGLIHTWEATLVCVFFAAFAGSMVISTLILIRELLDEWLSYLEK